MVEENKNLFQDYCYKFELDIGNPITTYELENDPLNFDSIVATLGRDLEGHGFKYEFIDDGDNIRLEFDNCRQRQEILTEWNDNDGDGYVFLRLMIDYGSGYVVEWSARADLNELDNGFHNCDEDGVCEETVILPFERILLGDKFRTRYETKINLLDTEDLDGNDIGTFELQDLYLHSKVTLLQNEELFNPDIENYFQSGQVDNNYWEAVHDNSVLIIDPISEVLKAGFKQPFNYSTNVYTAAFDKLTLEDQLNDTLIFQNNLYRYQLDTEQSIKATVTGNYKTRHTISHVRLSALYDRIITSVFFDSFIVVRGDNGLIKNEYLLVSESFTGLSISEFNAGDPSTTYTYDIDTFFNVKIEASLLDEIYLVSRQRYSSINTGIGEVRTTLDVVETEISYNWDFGIAKSASLTKGHYIYEVLDRALLMITGQNVLSSNILTRIDQGALEDGIASRIFLATGLFIRNFSQEEFTVKVSDIIDFLIAKYNIGVNVELESGFEKVIVEYIDRFYQDVEILELTNVSEYTEKSDNLAKYNTIVSSNSKFADDDQGGLQGFNTEIDITTPIETYKKELNLNSPFITDDVDLETTRVIQFKETPNDSYSRDNNIYAIMLYRIGGSNFLNSDLYPDSEIEITTPLNQVITIKNTPLIYTTPTFVNITFQNTSGITDGVYSVTGGFAYDELNNSISFAATAGTLPDGVYTDFEVSFDFDTYIPQKTQEIENITNLLEPESAYNIGFHPWNAIFYHFPWFGSYLRNKQNSDFLNRTAGINNTSMTYNFVSGYDHNTIGVDTIGQKQYLLSLLRTYFNTIFNPKTINVKAKLSSFDFNKIRLSCLNESTGGDNLGYLSFIDENGNTRRFFPDKINYSPDPSIEEVEIEGREKAS